ncbi:flagellar basal body rod protein [Amphibacillus sp. Q70]|uniref:lmo0954 family membrane protein n=1 Tax=Amphibacillus sp. Q70 TaxID=3453416 RepID=UPI003F83A768
MRSLILITVIIIAGMIILSSIAPLIALLISLAIVYYSVRRFLLTDSVGAKIGWGIVGLIGLSMSLSNTYALVGVAAVVLLYYAYHQYKKNKYEKTDQDWIID